MSRIRFLKQWRAYKPGDEADLGNPVGEIIVQRGFAEWLPEPDRELVEREVECMAEEPPENAMKPKPRRRRRTKPKAGPRTTTRTRTKDKGK